MVNYANLYMNAEENFYARTLIENNKELSHDILNRIEQKVDNFIQELSEDEINNLSVMCLQSFDKLWSDMLTALDEIRQNVSLRQVAQKYPLYEFKNMCFDYFSDLINNFQSVTISNYFTLIEMKEQALLEQAVKDNQFISLDEINEKGEILTDEIELAALSHDDKQLA